MGGLPEVLIKEDEEGKKRLDKELEKVKGA